MLKKIYIIAVVMLILAAGVIGSNSLEAASVESKNPYDFTLKDVNGKSHSLADFKDAKAVVVVYVATRCPISNAHNKRMAELYKEFKAKNIAFIGINSNKMEGVDEIKEHAQKHGLSFPILKDVNNVVADRYKASVTPEAYVLGKNWELLYHGRIDDSRRENQVKSQDLNQALMEIIKDKEVTVKKTKAFGCTIKRVKKEEK
ncbi:MAG: redoxin domain-containing protein [Candidatus Aminicenantes bacterium]|nr:redoxin domain-containing protein [Candidatus Aminicenantes bacterium]NIM81142.1 redoxin domain-containing protein [Candidatus Aminicenantes bacterium]NIN20516.1 redoxin domain-containing protein [Candidatus Aminicenantes bacterium]NIN44289.1 redoxin domain-containing protein [Candidatus Aminicenantes bacterium]NIN87108.1 redoxin domain-containing protein [Candidatus Aminicenantes bacterium]